MSKPISISFGKSKAPSIAPLANGALGRKPISFAAKSKQPALRHESDDEDEQEPVHEEVTGFAADGAVLSRPVEQKDALVIQNAGNGDWRTRGKKNLLPAEVQAQRQADTNGTTIRVERNEVSKAMGLQFAESTVEEAATNGHVNGNIVAVAQPVKEMTEDEAALKALLSNGDGERQTNAVIIQSENARAQGMDTEADDFKADVASRPDVPTLDEYAAMPVEEFGLAMLRGMGRKRKANGDIVNYSTSDPENRAPRIREPRGYLGIGARAEPGAVAELGAWGKADMRKNKKGEGLYTPVMLRDKRTGEMITEKQLEERKKESRRSTKPSEEDWRDRRDRNLEKSSRDSRNGEQRYITANEDSHDQVNESSRSSSSRRDRDESSGQGRDRSRSRERSRRDDTDRSRHRDKYRADARYDSSSSRRSSHRDRDRDSDRDKDGARDRDRRRDR